MRPASAAAAVLLLCQQCTALLAPQVERAQRVAPQAAPATHLKAARIEGLLDEALVTKRTNTHRCLKELRKKAPSPTH